MPERQKITKIILACLWVSLVIAAGLTWRHSGLTLAELPERIEIWLRSFGMVKASVIYVFIFILRPLILFPASILVLVSGAVFGPWLGILFTAIGENASAGVAFFVARYFGGTWEKDQDTHSLKKWQKKLRDNGLITVMTLRFLFVHFDLVNYACGASAIRYRDFFVGTFIGIIPGMVSFVLFGSLLTSNPGVERGVIILLSLFFFVIGLLVAGWIKQREIRAARQAEP